MPLVIKKISEKLDSDKYWNNGNWGRRPQYWGQIEDLPDFLDKSTTKKVGEGGKGREDNIAYTDAEDSIIAIVAFERGVSQSCGFRCVTGEDRGHGIRMYTKGTGQ